LDILGSTADVETGMVYLAGEVLRPGDGAVHHERSDESMTRSLYAYVFDNPLNAADPLGLGILSTIRMEGASAAAWYRSRSALLSTLASHAAAVAQNVTVACAADLITAACAPFAESIELALSAGSTVGTAEITLCATVGFSSGCLAGGAVTLVSSLPTGVSLKLTGSLREITMKAILADANAAVNTATVRSQ
jgi:hypothetical protein